MTDVIPRMQKNPHRLRYMHKQSLWLCPALPASSGSSLQRHLKMMRLWKRHQLRRQGVDSRNGRCHKPSGYRRQRPSADALLLRSRLTMKNSASHYPPCVSLHGLVCKRIAVTARPVLHSSCDGLFGGLCAMPRLCEYGSPHSSYSALCHLTMQRAHRAVATYMRLPSPTSPFLTIV
eukprot:322783-Chlamydomonas_euryale.AAC.5